MKKHYRAVLLILLCISTSLISGCVDQSQQSKTDETKKGSKIISTSVVICEILDALEVNTVIGVPKSDSYELPERYLEIQKIGPPMSPDMELISTMEPDYILSPISLEGSLSDKYDAMNTNAYFVDLSSTRGMYESIEKMGELFNKETAADKLVGEYETFIKEYQKRNETNKPPVVLVLMGLPGSYVVATEQSYAGSLVKLAGGKNAYADEKTEPFLNINPEDMVNKDPDIILLTSHAMPEQVAKMFEEEFSNNDIWKHFRAVTEEQVYTLDHNKFGMSANFKYKEALADLEAILYGSSQKQ